MDNLKLYLAPVRGITDLIYRNCFSRHFAGIDLAVTPFLTTVKGNQIKPSHSIQYALENNKLPIIPQIIGKNPEHFIVLSNTLQELGNEHINWNLGCPYPTMTRKKCGSGLLPYPDLIHSFLDKVFSKCSVKISVKVRLGLEVPDELMALLPIFNQYPLEMVMIHPRLGKQQYKGSVDLDSFEKAYRKCQHPVVYNGDIFTVDDFTSLQTRFPDINEWMLGRGLFQNPFLAEEIKTGKSYSEREKLIKLREFHDDLFDAYSNILSGFSHLNQRMQAHWQYLHKSINNGNKLIKKLKKTKTVEDYKQILNHYL